VCAIGDGRPYNVALVTLDPDGAAAFDGDLPAEVEAQIGRANERLSGVNGLHRWPAKAASLHRATRTRPASTNPVLSRDRLILKAVLRR
jgi:hypothetical protein